MMKKTTCETFVAVLTTIKERGITTRTALMADRRLYEEFWYAACDFSAYCLLSKTGKLTKTARSSSGRGKGGRPCGLWCYHAGGITRSVP